MHACNARVDGKLVYVWVDIDIREKCSNSAGENLTTTATVKSPNYNFSEKQENLEQSGQGESTWLDENREVKE